MLKKYTRRRINIFLLSFLIVFGFLILFSSQAFSAPENKRILGLYKSTENSTEKNNAVKNFLTPSLEKLGYQVDYYDAIQPLPSEEEMKKYDAVVTFFWGPVHPNPEAYISWLKKQVKNGKKIVMIGNFGAHTKDGKKWVSAEELNEFFFPFGLSFKGSKPAKRNDLKVIEKNEEVIESIPGEVPSYFLIFDSINDTNKPFLSMQIKEDPSTKSYLVIKTPGGGMAQIGYCYSMDKAKPGQLIWSINRDEFLKDVLSQKAVTAKKDVVKEKKVLALFKSSEKKTKMNNFIRKFAAEHLVRMGYELEYYDIDKGIPSDDKMNEFSVIITWFHSGDMKNAPKYCEWLADQIAAQKKVIIIGNFGAYTDVIQKGADTYKRFMAEYEYNNFFYPFGLRMDGQWTNKPDLLKLDYLDPKVVNRSLLDKPKDLVSYYRFKSIYPQNKSFLTLSRKDVPNSESSLVAVTPYGGMIFQGYTFKQDPKTWRIDFIVKFKPFLEECLKERDFTPPRVFTINVDTEKELARVKSQQHRVSVPPPCEKPILRKVLVLYKGSEFPRFNLSPFYLYTGPILNHLGLLPDYVDIEKEKPGDKKMEEYRAVITWFNEDAMIGADEYVNWLSKQIDNGKRVVILDSFGAFFDRKDYRYIADVDKVFKKLGLEYADEYEVIKTNLSNLQTRLLTMRVAPSYDPFALYHEMGRVSLSGEYFTDLLPIYYDKNYFDYEKPLKIASNTTIVPVKSFKKDNKVLLKIQAFGKGEVTPAVIAPWGGALLGDFFYREYGQFENKKSKRPTGYEDLLNVQHDTTLSSEKNNGYWTINPFKFFTETLDLETMPKPDYTTLNGHRIFYTHIDGDGLTNISYMEPTKYAGEVILEEIFSKYNLPISGSVIVEEMVQFQKKYYNRPFMIGERIFALDNIEVSCHSYTHPFNLVRGDLQITIKGKGKKEDKGYEISYLKSTPEKEVLYSSALINQNMVPAGKTMEIILWPGMCNPTAEFLKKTVMLGIENLNGGDPIYDDKHKSYSNLCPAFTKKGEYLQIHTSGCNDYIYTNQWTGNYDGMKNLVKHFKHTEKPIRIIPINIYYHYYSGMYKKSLDALKIAHNYALSQKIAPIFASQYSDIVKDFYHTKTGVTGDGGYEIKNSGFMRTVRFDKTKKVPDLKRSKNIIGFDFINDSLYVFLDESKEHTIYLTDKPVDATYLKGASHYIKNWKTGKDSVTAVLEGLGPGSMELCNMKPNADYQVQLGDMDKTVKTDKDGNLNFKYEFKGKPASYNLVIRVK